VSGTGLNAPGVNTTGIVVFSYSQWQFRYPELAAFVPAGMAAAYFAEAGLYVDNSPCGIVTDLGRRALILNMLVAHLAALNAPLNGQPSSPLVGRISNASEGSVSVATALTVPGSAEWFATTKYGLAAWQALAPYRTARYVPGPGAWAGFNRRW
jgi:hypothetical protein